jgi:hypothetical protein
LLGNYKNFPENIHGIAFFEYQNSTKSLQQAILFALHHLNHETYNLGSVTPYLKQNYEVGFEFGVAEDFDFNFLDNKELERCTRSIAENELETLDFFFTVRYHNIMKDNKRTPLKFDYHLLRFIFQRNGLELRIRHERGPQRVATDDLTEFIALQINRELSKKQLTPLIIGDFTKVNIK